MREILRNLRKNNKAGFTLAELLIVIAITGVLAAFGFGQVAAYQKKLKRTEMDNVAREIFVAAQNHLTASKAAGTWNTAFYNESTSSSMITSTDWQKPITYTISDYPTEEESGTVQTAAVHKYYYVVYNSTTYKDALTSSKSVLSQLLPYGSIDETIRSGGSYIIEFDASTQTIYGVFYTEGTAGGYLGSDNSRSYFTSDAETLGLNKVRGDDEASARADFTLGGKQVAVGYYGGATAVKNESTQLSQPEITINNGRVLEVVVLDKNKTSKNNTISITVTPTSVTSTDVAKEQQATINIDPNSTSPITGTNINPANFAQNTVWWTVDTSAGREYHIVFDNIFGKYTHFVNLFKLIAPGSNIQVSAAVSYKGNKSGTSGAKDTNSIFGNVSLENTTSTVEYSASIENGRHLANLSKDVSGYAKTNELNITSASLSLNMINESTNIFNWGSFAGSDSVTKTDGNSVSGSRFLSIDNQTLKTFKGNNLILKNFNVLSDGQAAGLFSVGYGLNISNLDLVDFKVYASQSCGTLIGKANAGTSITNVHVYNSSSNTYGTGDGQYWINSSQNYAGGLVGEINGSTSIYNSSASVKVGKYTSSNATKASGGLIGAVTSGSVDIEESYVGGKNHDDDTDLSVSTANIYGTAAGGFIGTVTSGTTVITNSYTTASVYGSSYSGGFIADAAGASGALTVDNVYAANEVDGDSSYTGLFAGIVESNKNRLVFSSKSYVISNISENVSALIGSKQSYSLLSTVTSKQLKALRTASTTGSAVPYSDLGTDYPYPTTKVIGTTTAVTHHGDWVYIGGSKQVTLKKNIHFTSQIGDAQTKATILNNILNNTSIIFTDEDTGESTEYKFSDTGIIVETTTDGYTLTIPAEMTIGDTYTVNESTASSLRSQFVSTSTYYSYAFYNKAGNAQNGRSETDQQGTTISDNNFKLNKNESVNITFDNYYQKYYSGTVYYEIYDDNSHYMHGYNGSEQAGLSSGFPTTATTKVSQDGYLFVLSNQAYNYAYNFGNPEDTLSVYFGANEVNDTYTWQWVSLSYLLSHGYITDVTNSLGATLGIENSHVYKMNFDLAYTNGFSYWNLWENTGYSWLSFAYEYTYYNIVVETPINAYCMNPFYADTVSIAGSTKGTYKDALTPKVRSASQLKRIFDHDGYKVLRNNSGNVVTQELNIDMSGYTYSPISQMYKTTYQGAAFPNTAVYPSLTGLSNTFVRDVSLGSSIKNLNVTTSITGVNTGGYSANYGAFISRNEGTVANVNFVNCKISNSTFGTAMNIFDDVGIIGFNNSNAAISNVTFTGTTYQNVTIYALYSGVIGISDTSTKLENVTISNTTYDHVTAAGTYFGVIGQNTAAASNLHIADSVWTNVTTSANYSGIIGQSTASSILDGAVIEGTTFNNVSSTSSYFGIIGENDDATSNLTIKNTNWTNVSANSSFVGLIGYQTTSISNLTIDGMQWTNDANQSVKATGVGVIGKVHYIATMSNPTIQNIVWNGISAATNSFGIIGASEEISSGMKIAHISWNNITVTASSFSATLPSYAAIIPSISRSADATSITDVTIQNMTSNAYYSGIIGNVSSTLTNTTVSQVKICNDASSTASITGRYFGLIGNVASSSVSGLTVQAGDTAQYPVQYGFWMDNLKLNVRYWGVIGANSGTIKGYISGSNVVDNNKLSGIILSNIDWSNSIKATETTSNNGRFAGGIIGSNSSSFANTVIKNITISAIKLPVSTNSSSACFGIFGYNGSTIDSVTASDYQFASLSTVNPTSGAAAAMTDYAFIYYNNAAVKNTSISYPSTPAGYAVYKTNKGTFDANCKLYVDGTLTPIK
jgi:prepilin-type N-terminal cleavage/methylation domain-containing protein